MMENIAILCGGNSDEKIISIDSAQNIYENIDKNKYNAFKIIHRDNLIFEVLHNKKKIQVKNNDFSFLIDNNKYKIDKVFMMIHGDPGENGNLCDFFDDLNIPYTNSNKEISNITFDKYLCNTLLKKKGFDVPSSFIYSDDCKINFPCIIKPTSSGSSLGISKVNHTNEVSSALKKAKKSGNKIMIEEFLEGREFTCAVYRSKKKIISLPITEIISFNDFFDYDAKYNNKSLEITPAKIPKSIAKNIKSLSKEIYAKLSMRGIVRIDYILHNKKPFIIEINTVPGFSKKSIVPQMLKSENIKISDFISEQLDELDSN